MMTFKEYLSLNNISLRRDENGNVGFLTHEATDGRTGELKTFHVLQGENSNGKFLFIPSLGAWDEHESGTRNLGDCEVVDNGIKANDGTPIFFLHRPVHYDGHTDIDISCEQTDNASVHTLTLRRYANENGIAISGDYFNKQVTNREGVEVIYHILPGNTPNGQVLFIPSLGAWDEHESGTRNLGDCEVVDNGEKANDGTPIIFLHRPLHFDGSIDIGENEDSIRSYPLVSEYVNAIMLAEENLDKLSNLRPVLDIDGRPVMSNGNFAVVFKMENLADGKLYALKCFTKFQEGRDKAYKLISNELESISTDYMTSIKYLPKELYVNSSICEDTEFPVLLMDWIEGVTLDKYIRNHLWDQNALHMLAFRFCQMASWLLEQTFAHSDLKPDNILVRPDGSIIMVDYDGMYVPTMRGQRARELGSPDYRHPLRTFNDFNERIDDFSLATIAMQLYAIYLEPGLLSNNEGDSLLLCERDYHTPSQSAIMKQLYNFTDNLEFTKLMGIYQLAFSQNSLMGLSHELFSIDIPQGEELSTKVSNEDMEFGIEDENGGLYSPDRIRMICYCALYGDEYTIAPNTKIICDLCFFDAYNENDGHYLQRLYIPSSVEKIGENPFCRSIENIVCDSPFFAVEGKYLLSANRQKIVFYFGKEKDIRLPESVTHIGSGAFCSMELSSFYIPKSVIQIDDNPFVDDLNRYNDESHPMEMVSDSPCFEVRNHTLYSKPDHRIIAFWGKDKDYSVPDGTSIIGPNAFFGADLVSINLPGSIEYIHETAFYWCFKLDRIVVPFGTKERFKRLIANNLENLITEFGDDLPF